MKLQELRNEKQKVEEDFLQSQLSSEEKEQRLFHEESSLIQHLKQISQKENLLAKDVEEGKNDLYFDDFKIISKSYILIYNKSLLIRYRFTYSTYST